MRIIKNASVNGGQSLLFVIRSYPIAESMSTLDTQSRAIEKFVSIIESRYYQRALHNATDVILKTTESNVLKTLPRKSTTKHQKQRFPSALSRAFDSLLNGSAVIARPTARLHLFSPSGYLPQSTGARVFVTQVHLTRLLAARTGRKRRKLIRPFIFPASSFVFRYKMEQCHATTTRCTSDRSSARDAARRDAGNTSSPPHPYHFRF